jgi:basic membrane protein A
MLTKTNVVGCIGGQDMPPIRGVLDGFAKGAKHVKPDVEILSAMTGSFDDVAKAKETALAMISENADIITAAANQAGLGSIEACKEKGIFALGVNQDQNSIAPDTVVVSAIKSAPVLITFVVEKVLNDELEPKFL